MIKSRFRVLAILAVVLVAGLLNTSRVYAKPIALVYYGPGACLTCWTSASHVAQKAGFDVRLVNAKFKHFELFKKAKLWVQPGGKSKTAALAMGPEYLKQIRDFVARGGAYVGFCAGAFLSTEKIGTSDADGLGIVPGKTQLWDEDDGAPQFVDLEWNGKHRSVYYHGGPFIDLSEVSNVEIRLRNLKVISHYENDGKIAALKTNFGLGRVAITGAHPEASKVWKLLRFKKDPDGSDQDLAQEMMKWATRTTE